MSERLSPHFTRQELACRHCGQLPPGGISRGLVLLVALIAAGAVGISLSEVGPLFGR